VFSWWPFPWPWPRPKPPTPTPIPTPAPGTSLAALYQAINVARVKLRLPTLAPDPRLEAVAARRVAALARRGVLDHAGFDADIRRAVPAATAEGEVLAAGQATPAMAVSDWLADAPHRAELLGDFTLMGAGVAEARDGMLYWCVDFARV
jgi:uncharacterized protein YkwD